MSDSRASSSSAPSTPRSAVQRRRRDTAEEAARARRLHRSEQWPDDLAAVARDLVIRSRRAQGLPDHVTDPVLLAKAAEFVLGHRTCADREHPAGVPP